MKKEQEKKHLNKLWKKAQQHFKNFTHHQDPEELHQFRVQVKKIRSFLTLLAEHKNNAHLVKTFKPVKKIFHLAGVVRDAALHVKQAKEAGIELAAFFKEQDDLQKQTIEKLVHKGKKHLRKMKEVKQQLQEQLHPVTATEIQTFYEKQLLHTQQLLEQHNFSEELHNARKMLKHLLYNQHAVQDGIATKLAIHFDYIDELQSLLGQWHDNKLALAFFTEKLDTKDLLPLQAKNGELEEAITEKGSDFSSKAQGAVSS